MIFMWFAKISDAVKNLGSHSKLQGAEICYKTAQRTVYGNTAFIKMRLPGVRLNGLSLAGAGGYISGSSFFQGNSSNVALQVVTTIGE